MKKLVKNSSKIRRNFAIDFWGILFRPASDLFGTSDIIISIEHCCGLLQTVISMPGFRSLAEGELVEFEFKESDKGLEATYVGGLRGTPCQGSERRPVSKKKYKKMRSV